MNKNTCVIYAPVNIYGGYPSHSRDKCKAIIELRKEVWDIKIISCGWGSLPENFLTDNEEWSWMKEYILQGPLNYKPDYMFFITIPTEAHPVGKWNCSINAGIETNMCDGSWIEAMNQMDMNWVSSNHSKNVYQSLMFDKIDKQGNKLGQLRMEKPIEVVFEGCNTEQYFPIQADEDIFNLSNIKEQFLFLFVGHWIGNDLMNDRKKVGLLIKLFYETFKNIANPPALVLKASTGTSSYMNKDEILKRILKIRKTVVNETLPNIYLLNGNVSDDEMNNLYNHPRIKSMISLSSGEGYGRPLAEFSMVKKPIITTNWSGQLDFLDPSLTTLLPGELKQVHPSVVNQWILKDAKWFEVDQKASMDAMKGIFNNYKNYLPKALKQGHINRTKFNYDKMKELIDKLLIRDIPKFPVYQPVNLPKPKRIE